MPVDVQTYSSSWLQKRTKSALRFLSSPEHLAVVAVSVLLGFALHWVLFGGSSRLQGRQGQQRRGSLLVRALSLLGLSALVVETSDYSASSSAASSKSSSSSSSSSSNSAVGESSSDSGDPAAPKHIAVIMDGNRRFGRERHNDALQGHWAGGQTLVDFISWCIEEGLEVATLYAFSSENWSRDPLEVSALMGIFAKYAEQLTTEALARNVRVYVMSTDLQRLPATVQGSISKLVAATQGCSGFTVNICISYGGRDEILAACGRVATLARDGRLGDEPSASAAGAAGGKGEGGDGGRCSGGGGGGGDVVVSEALFRAQLCSAHTTDPDLLIRTSGECRLSNFLLWQLAYTELFFVDKYWPEMTREDLREVLAQYRERHRRFGG